MSPELITAVKERLELGYTTEAIREELQSAGHPDSVIEQVLQIAPSVNKIPTFDGATTIISNALENQLPKASDLFMSSLAFAKNRFGLALALAAPFSLILIVGYISNTFSQVQLDMVSTLIGLVSLIALVSYLLVLGASLYIVANGQERPVHFSEAFTWVKQNVWGLLWIYILTALVVYGGFLLFIIPGIIISFLVYFSQYVYVKEGIHGLDALLRSRDLVKGKWWDVAGLLILIGLMFLATFLILGGVIGLISGLIGDSPTTEFLFALIFQLISAGVTLMGMHIGMEVYKSLASARPMIPGTPPATDKWKYRLLAASGIIFPLIVLALLVAFLNLNSTTEGKRMDEFDTYLSTSAKERAAELRAEKPQTEVIVEGEVDTVIIE